MSRIAFQGKYSRFLVDLYNRNKMLLLISTLIFFSSIFVGYLISGTIDYFMKTIIDSVKGKFSQEGINTLSIFMNNIKSGFIAYVGGIIGIVPVFVLFINGIIIGYLATKIPTGTLLLYTVPHGIFEIPAIIISATAGFRITSMIVHILINLSKDKPVNENYWELKDSIALFAIAIVLFFIAAAIEANVTLALGDYIKSLI